MGEQLNLFTPMHERGSRDYVGRLMDEKVRCMVEARKFEENYWDGERRYGYGGYYYQSGRWRPMAEALIDRYDLKPGDSVMDLGCGKGFLLYEMQLLMPRLDLHGIDRSQHAIANRHPDLRANLACAKVQDIAGVNPYSLAISLGMFHNLTLRELWRALPLFQYMGKRGYLMVEAFRDESEWFNLTAWCLTAESLMRPEDWLFLYEQCGYTGDYEFIYFT